MTAPRVSVVVPCFELGATLGEAVESALAQTLPDLEILVVDDGSRQPETRRILDGLERPKTRVIRAAHGGLAAARNLGLRQSRGTYVCALDADDLLEPTYLEKAAAALDADPSLTFVSSWLRAFGEEDFVWRKDRCDLPALLAECTVTTAALVRREALLTVGGWDEGMPDQGDEDWDLWISLTERGHRGAILPEVLFLYRRRTGSMASVCTSGEPARRLARYRHAKHRDAYRRCLVEVLRLKGVEAATLARDVERADANAGAMEELTGLVAGELERVRRGVPGPTPAREGGLLAALRRSLS